MVTMVDDVDAPLEFISAAHVLITYMGGQGAGDLITRTKEEARTLAEEVQRRAVTGEESFGDLAKKYSEDESNASGGGDLGEFDRTTMVPPFTEAAFGLEVDGISEVVETPFGFHVIKRTK